MRVLVLRIKSIFIYILTIFIGCVSQSSVPVAGEAGETMDDTEAVTAGPDRAGEIFTALKRAYPGRFGEIETVDGDLTITLDGVRFFWAGGKILPESDLPRREEYTRQPFYQYPRQLAPIPEYTPEMKVETDKWVERRNTIPPARHPGLFTRLWGVTDARSADRRSRALKFLGKGVRVHLDLVPVLRHVQGEIRERARTDPELARFIRSIRTVSGLYWRKIARTKTLSFHSFGAAVDVVSANPKRKETYWLWAKARDKEWYTRPLSVRHMPPASFVEVFEKYGFVWGGKWLFYDTLHFEYRPEILLLNGFTLER
jgi:hypothetical protein